MTYNELRSKIRETVPNAYFEVDNEGQVIVHTNLHKIGNHENLVDYAEPLKNCMPDIKTGKPGYDIKKVIELFNSTYKA